MELPESIILSQQMHKELKGTRISNIEVSNPKCLNMPFEKVKSILTGAQITSVKSKGKWIFIFLPAHVILFNPGMGADILYFTSKDDLPEKYQIKIEFEDKTGFTIRVWWFCYFHVVSKEGIGTHKMTASLGMEPLDDLFTLEYFKKLLKKRRAGIKSFLLNQKNIAGIGNFYIHDILFRAKIHPLRKIPSLTPEEIEALYYSIQKLLSKSVELNGSQ
jgi:formamidopyrimidine-DNA glycosylase